MRGRPTLIENPPEDEKIYRNFIQADVEIRQHAVCSVRSWNESKLVTTNDYHLKLLHDLSSWCFNWKLKDISIKNELLIKNLMELKVEIN